MTTPLIALEAQRRMTKALIDDDPTVAAVVPHAKTLSPSGTPTYTDGTPRAAQRFKLSLLAYDQRPTVTLAGVERLIDYHLIAEHDAVLEVGDWWTDAENTKFEIVGFSEGWDYEIKAFVVRHVPREANP